MRGEEWAVIQSPRFGDFDVVGPISRETPQRVYHPSRWGRSAESFTDLGNVLFKGDEESCRRLEAKLTSSKALCTQEILASKVRHAKRIADLCAAALSTPPQKKTEGE